MFIPHQSKLRHWHYRQEKPLTAYTAGSFSFAHFAYDIAVSIFPLRRDIQVGTRLSMCSLTNPV